MDDNLKELEALREENERLKAKNEKLYKDCVTFAKRIKAHEDIDSKIAALEEENNNLKAEVEKLSLKPLNHKVKVKAKAKEIEPDDNVIEPLPSEEVLKEPETLEVEESEEVVEVAEEVITSDQTYESFMNSDDEAINFPAFTPDAFENIEQAPEEIDEDLEPEDIILPKNHSNYKKSPFRTFIRVLLIICLIFSLLVGIASSVTYLFSTAYADYAISNYRFACVRNSALSPSYTTDDIVLIKYSNFSGIELGKPVVTTKDGRSIGSIKSVDVKDGEYIATIEDKSGTYEVNEDQFYGQVIIKIPYAAKIVAYASANPYNYLAIVVSANLICIALLLIIPSNKSKKPKFGKDYDVEDFTI